MPDTDTKSTDTNKTGGSDATNTPDNDNQDGIVVDNDADFILLVDGEEVYRTQDEIIDFELTSPQGPKATVRKGDMVVFNIVTRRRGAGGNRHISHVENAVAAIDAARREGNTAGPNSPTDFNLVDRVRPAHTGTVTGVENDTVRAMTERENEAGTKTETSASVRSREAAKDSSSSTKASDSKDSKDKK